MLQSVGEMAVRNGDSERISRILPQSQKACVATVIAEVWSSTAKPEPRRTRLQFGMRQCTERSVDEPMTRGGYVKFPYRLSEMNK